MSSNTQDPQLLLPQESFLKFFDFLPTPSTVTSTSVSRSWRQHLLGSTTTFRTIDLTCLSIEQLDESEKEFEMNSLIKLLLYFSSQTGFKLTDVSFHVGSFWSNLEKAIAWEWSRISILYSVLQLSKDSLKHLTISTPSSSSTGLVYYEEAGQDGDETLSLDDLAQIIKNLSLFPHLQTFELIGLTSFDLFSSNPESFKSFRITNLDERGQDGTPLADFTRIMREAMDFTQTGLKEFCSPCLEYEDELVGSILKELMDWSKETLEKLHLHFIFSLPQVCLDLILSCPNLLDLDFSPAAELPGTDTWKMAIDKDYSIKSNLKRLKLLMDRTQIEWSQQLNNWAGGKLEYLSLDLVLTLTSFNGLTSLLQSVQCSLKVLDLEDIDIDYSVQQIKPSLPSFQNLETLTFKCVSSSVVNYISTSALPNLKFLSFNHKFYGSSWTGSLPANFQRNPLMTLEDIVLYFKKAETKLEVISTGLIGEKLPDEDEIFHLDFMGLGEVKELNLDNCPFPVAQFLSKLQYPELVDLYLPFRAEGDSSGLWLSFQKGSPKLWG